MVTLHTSIYFFVFNLFLFLLSSCDTKQLQESEVASQNPKMAPIEVVDTTKIKYGKPFFNYDEIDYYHIDIGIPKFKGKCGLSDSILCRAVCNLVLSDSTRNIYISDSDTILEEKNFKYYPKLGFNKYSIKQEDFTHINQVFCAKSGGELVSASCIPIYRDHLVFKRKSKIVGHIFVCLSCMQYVVNGKIEHKGDLGYEIDNIRLRRVFSKYDKNAAKHY